MNKKLVILCIALAIAMPLQAASTKSIVDDTGTNVEIPEEPMRIVALHDKVLTVPLLELGVKLVGSHGRGETEDSAFIRSSRSITGIDFDNSDIKWVGNFPVDIERVAALKPDLILVTDWQPLDINQLRKIAPTVLIDQSKHDAWQIYDILAEITGTVDKLTLMKRRYADQIKLIKTVIDTENTMVSTIHANKKNLFAYNLYGNIGKVLIDAGFQRPKIITDIPMLESRKFSAESLQAFDADFIITTYASTNNEYPADVQRYFENIMPNYCQVLHACREGQMLLVSRSLGGTTSYYALGAVTYMILSEIGGKNFIPMVR